MAKVKQGTKASSNKLVRKDSQKGGMPSGVGYRTFDKAGNSTNYASSKDAAGYNDTTQSRADMSKGDPLYRADSAGKVITSATLAPTTPINLPTPPAVDGLYGVTDTANAGLAGVSGGTYDPKTKQMVAPTGDELFKSYQNANASAFGDMTSSEDRLKEQQKMLRPKEKAVNSLTAQLNSITTNRDAEMLRLEGQGRGVTESIIGGQQAQISREAAIQAMPVQAQLAIAQDDLESARSYASQLFQAQSQDAQAMYAYKKDLNASIYNFLDSKEKARVAQNEKALDRTFAIEQANRSTLKQLSMQAIDNGQSALAAEIMKANPGSETFDADFGDYASRLRKPVTSTSAWELKDVNGQSMWVNKSTQETKPVGGGSSAPVTLSYEDNAKFNATPETKAIKDSVNYAQSVQDYKDAINTYGTGEVMGKGAGALNQAYSSLVGATKDYYTLGSYDNGVQKLIALGIQEPSVFGLKTSRISALDTALSAAKGKIDKSVAQLEATRFGNSVEFKELASTASKFSTPVAKVDFSVILPDDDEEIGAAFGIPGSTLSTNGFAPAKYFQ